MTVRGVTVWFDPGPAVGFDDVKAVSASVSSAGAGGGGRVTAIICIGLDGASTC